MAALLKLNSARYLINSAKDKAVADINKTELNKTKFILSSCDIICNNEPIKDLEKILFL